MLFARWFSEWSRRIIIQVEISLLFRHRTILSKLNSRLKFEDQDLSPFCIAFWIAKSWCKQINNVKLCKFFVKSYQSNYYYYFPVISKKKLIPVSFVFLLAKNINFYNIWIKMKEREERERERERERENVYVFACMYIWLSVCCTNINLYVNTKT